MSIQPFDPRRLDVPRFALEAGVLEGTVLPGDLLRLTQETATPATADTPVVIDWQAQGERRRDAGLGDGVMRPALYLRVHACLSLVCQRCLQPAWTVIAVDRHFLFAPDEAQAMRLDEHAHDDVLVAAVDFDLLALIEDELLLALPLAPRHDHCPQALPVQGSDFDARSTGQPHPFAALAGIGERKRTDNL
jgi:uncharacterized protein